MPTISVENYLKEIYHLQTHGDGRVKTKALADRLGISLPSVTSMLKALAKDDLVDYQPYQGAKLSEAGMRVALRVIRNHRLLEVFLVRALGLSWDEVHEEAERLEHVVSDEFTERLARHLGDPAFDPHGDPIPRSDGSLPTGPDMPLSEAPVGAGFVVHRVLTQDGEVLAHLHGLGVEPGRRLTVVGREPGGHLLNLRVERRHGETEAGLSSALAAVVLGIVTPV